MNSIDNEMSRVFVTDWKYILSFIQTQTKLTVTINISTASYLFILLAVVIFITEFFLAREGMLFAYDEGMINGDYVFIMFQLDQNQAHLYSKHQFKWFFSSYPSTLQRRNHLKKAFEAAFVLAIKLPSSHNFTHFKKEIKRRSKFPPFNSTVYEGYLWKNYRKFLANRTEVSEWCDELIYASDLDAVLQQWALIYETAKLIYTYSREQ